MGQLQRDLRNWWLTPEAEGNRFGQTTGKRTPNASELYGFEELGGEEEVAPAKLERYRRNSVHSRFFTLGA